ncbi:MAG: NUDIX hydrolase [Thermoplasmata archaeon]
MAEVRKFARFRRSAEPDRLVFQVPEEGLCLSTFLVLRPRGHEDRVLLGHLQPGPDWEQLGAVDRKRAELWSKGWMLPSSQLFYYETPADSARRIAQEQLGVELPDLPSPILMSDSEQRPSARPGDLHWDLGFVYVVEDWPEQPPRHPAWTELRFVEVAKVHRGEFVRSQHDVLALVGMACAD